MLGGCERDALKSDVVVTNEAGVAIVSLNRPRMRNAITLAMWRELKAVFDALGQDRDVRAVVLTGASKDFSVGADVSGVRPDPRQQGSGGRQRNRGGRLFECDCRCEKAGHRCGILGGGCHCALACDFRLADDTAVFGIAAAKLSIVYGIRSVRRLLALARTAHAKRASYLPPSATTLFAAAFLEIPAVRHLVN